MAETDRGAGAAAAPPPESGEAALAASPAGETEKKKTRRPSAREMINRGERIGGVTLCADGKYRWVHELKLLKTPVIYFLVWKIFFFVFLGIFGVTMLVDAVQFADFFPDRLLENLRFLGIFLAGMTAVTGLGYLLYAALMGGTYDVIFEMDERGINHKQTAPQARKARRLASLTVLAGKSARNLTTMGVGVNAARTEMYSDFSRVRKVKAYPALGLIKVNGRLSLNQVYAAKEDLPFVLDYILAHCDNLKSSRRGRAPRS